MSVLNMKSYVWLCCETGYPERVQNRSEMPSCRLLQSFWHLTLGRGSGVREKWMESIDT